MIYTVTLNPAVDRELAVPAIEFDSVLRASEWRVDWGGKGFNVSRMLKALGAPSVALGFAGGKSGEMLHDGLQSLDITPDFTWVDGETRTNVSIVTAARDHYVKVNEPGPTIGKAAQTALLERVRSLAKPDTWWVLAGSLPPGVPATVYADLVTTIQTLGGWVLLDTSGQALKHGCQAGPFLAKPNDVELRGLTGMPVSSRAEVLEAARAVLGLGVAHVVVSLGKAGALLVDRDGAWLAGSPSIEERNPIGAGDSMVGGLVWRLSLGGSLPEALRWGVACGAATASQDGTAVGTRDQVEHLVTQVTLTEVGPRE